MADEVSMRGGAEDIGRAVQALGLGEKLAVLGAVGVLAVWLVFGLLTEEYGIGQTPFVISAVAVFLAYRFHMQKATDWPVPYTTLLIVLAGILGLLGVREFLLDMRNEIYDFGGATFVGAILFWVTAIVAGVGAWFMATGRQ